MTPIPPPDPSPAASQPIDTTMAIVKDGADVVVSWAGGFSPYQLFQCHELSSSRADWSAIGNPTIALSKRLPMELNRQYFLVQQSIMLLNTDPSSPNTKLVWTVPDLE